MKAKGDGEEQRREHFRVFYPVSERPKIRILGEDYDVAEAAERGIKFCARKGAENKFEEIVYATITFHDGEFYDFEGKVKRLEKDEIVLQLSKGIPYKRIVKEQRYLIKKYPGYPETPSGS